MHAETGERKTAPVSILETLAANCVADVCLVTVRREQLLEVLPQLAAARGLKRIVVMVNHACGSDFLFDALGRDRTVLAFPGMAGGLSDGIVTYLPVAEQPTAVDETALDIRQLFTSAGLKLSAVTDMDAWLKRHAAFVVAICGALYGAGLDRMQLAQDAAQLRNFILSLRAAWRAMDRLGLAPAPLALRTIICWVPVWISTRYWSRFLAAPRAEVYFVQHSRHAATEMAALATDIRTLLATDMPADFAALCAAIGQEPISQSGG